MATLTDETVPDLPENPDEPRRARARRTSRPWWRRQPVKRATIWTHRWSALVLGLLLVAFCTSGVPLLYSKDVTHLTHRSAYAASGPATISMADARAAIQAHDPKFHPQGIWLSDEVYVGMDYDTGRRVTVDGSDGEVLGDFSAQAGVVGATMGFLVNFHDCLLSCEGYPGYQAWLAAEVPGTAWLGFEGAKVTWGGLLIGVSGLLLLFLAVSGVWLWWPGVKRWADGARVRWRKGRYARDFDLHQVAGMIAIPFLLMWAVTAMGFEFGFVERAWYAVLPGEAHEEATLESTKSKAPDVTLAAAEASAVAAAQLASPGARGPVGVDLPAADDPAGTYAFWFAAGYDPYGHTEYPGNLGIDVDRKDAARTAVTYGGPESPVAQTIWEDYNYTVHSGHVVGPWWRTVWVVLGLVPLLLAVTGLSTWLWKRKVRKRRRRSAVLATSPPVPVAVGGAAPVDPAAGP